MKKTRLATALAAAALAGICFGQADKELEVLSEASPEQPVASKARTRRAENTR